MSQPTTLQVLATLRSFKQNLTKRTELEETYVVKYHSLLADLRIAISEDLSYFSVDASDIKPHEFTTYQSDNDEGRTSYTTER